MLCMYDDKFITTIVKIPLSSGNRNKIIKSFLWWKNVSKTPIDSILANNVSTSTFSYTIIFAKDIKEKRIDLQITSIDNINCEGGE